MKRAAIAKKLIGDNGVLDGIIYPTIQMRGNADNIVLSKKVVDRKLQFVSVEYLEVDAANDLDYNVRILDSSAKVDLIGTIHWSGRGLQWQVPPQGMDSLCKHL